MLLLLGRSVCIELEFSLFIVTRSYVLFFFEYFDVRTPINSISLYDYHDYQWTNRLWAVIDFGECECWMRMQCLCVPLIWFGLVIQVDFSSEIIKPHCFKSINAVSRSDIVDMSRSHELYCIRFQFHTPVDVYIHCTFECRLNQNVSCSQKIVNRPRFHISNDRYVI